MTRIAAGARVAAGTRYLAAYAAPSGLKPYPQGLIHIGTPTTYSTGVPGELLKVNWSDMQSVALGPLVNPGLASLNTEIAWVDANPGAQLKFDALCGISAPAFAKAVQDVSNPLLDDGQPCAPITVVDHPGIANSQASGTVGAFWAPQYATYIADFRAKVAALVDGISEVLTVQLSDGMTIFPEPCQRQMTDGGGGFPKGDNLPQIAIWQMAGYSPSLDSAGLNKFIDLAAAAYPKTSLSMAFNPLENHDVIGPFFCTNDGATNHIDLVAADGVTPITPLVASAYAGGACIVTRRKGSGKCRTNPVGASAIVGFANFSTWGIVNGDRVYLDGVEYTANGTFATTFTSNDTINLTATVTLVSGSTFNNGTDLTGATFLIWPAVAGGTSPQAGWAINGNTTGQITILAGSGGNPGLPSLGTLDACKVFICKLINNNVGQGGPGDETSTFAVMQHAGSTLGTRFMIGNESLRQDYFPVPGGGPAPGTNFYNDIQLIHRQYGCPIWYQTATNANINGNYAGTDNPLLDTLYAAIKAGALYVELSATGYKTTKASTGGTLTVGTGAGAASLPITGDPLAGVAYTAGAGKYGWIELQTGNQYWFTSVGGPTPLVLNGLIEKVGPHPGQTTLEAGDEAAGLTWNIRHWAYIAPSVLTTLTGLLQANPASRARVTAGARIAS